jgi:hypothetical protein
MMKETAKSTTSYSVLKSCFIGKEGTVIELNPRQAANLLAGGYIALAKPVVKKGEVK